MCQGMIVQFLVPIKAAPFKSNQIPAIKVSRPPSNSIVSSFYNMPDKFFQQQTLQKKTIEKRRWMVIHASFSFAISRRKTTPNLIRSDGAVKSAKRNEQKNKIIIIKRISSTRLSMASDRTGSDLAGHKVPADNKINRRGYVFIGLSGTVATWNGCTWNGAVFYIESLQPVQPETIPNIPLVGFIFMAAVSLPSFATIFPRANKNGIPTQFEVQQCRSSNYKWFHNVWFFGLKKIWFFFFFLNLIRNDGSVQPELASPSPTDSIEINPIIDIELQLMLS